MIGCTVLFKKAVRSTPGPTPSELSDRYPATLLPWNDFRWENG
ncbi:hypothetical protein ABIB27_003283 [Arthrobacter sp. UYEF21]